MNLGRDAESFTVLKSLVIQDSFDIVLGNEALQCPIVTVSKNSWPLLRFAKRNAQSSFLNLGDSLTTQGQMTHQLLSTFYVPLSEDGWCIRARHPRQ